MNKNFDATIRAIVGKGASRRLRHANKFPAVIYGVGFEPLNVEMDHDPLFHAQENQEFYTETLTLTVDGKSIEVRVQDLQRHVYKPKLVHIDFKRV
jgi:large subunit ribosomal protein L25